MRERRESDERRERREERGEKRERREREEREKRERRERDIDKHRTVNISKSKRMYFKIPIQKYLVGSKQ
jgi:hypothetical protein